MSEVLKILNLELLLDRLLFYLRILINFLGELEELRGGNTCFFDPCFICKGGKSALGFVCLGKSFRGMLQQMLHYISTSHVA